MTNPNTINAMMQMQSAMGGMGQSAMGGMGAK
jgi:hypothetical protein